MKKVIDSVKSAIGETRIPNGHGFAEGNTE
jgi:hypothetical protein